MPYVIKDTVSGKYMSKSKTLESGTSNAVRYQSKVLAEAAAARLQKIYDNWDSDNQTLASRGYNNAYKAIKPTPKWTTQSV